MVSPLSRALLADPPTGVAVPRYDVAKVTPGIVHLGLGNFHRAHMARYTHDLMERDADALQWGIVGAGLLPGDRTTLDALAAQDRLYSLTERDGSGGSTTIIGASAGLIAADDDTSALLDAIDHDPIRIVSLTITQNGYCLDEATKRLDPDHPAIRHDVGHPAAPRTAIGIIVEAYRRRRDRDAPAFTALSCDNIQSNGDVLKRAVIDLATMQDETLAAWIGEHGRFPNAMVDRITPVTRSEDAAELAAHVVGDARPVFCEPFRQWVIEDRFAAGRPAWETVGVQLVEDVRPYEFMKLRLLNASHLALSSIGTLIGHRLVDEAMADADIAAFVRALMDEETGPTLPPVPGIDLEGYKALVIARFANPTIHDTLERINHDAPLNYLLDPLRDRLDSGASVDRLAFAVAAWMRRVRGVDEAGGAIPVRHPLAAELKARALEGGPDPSPLLALRAIFGDLIDHPAFVAAVSASLAAIYSSGMRHALASSVESCRSGTARA